MVGAVAGSPGTTPTGWIPGNAGLTRTIVGIGIENGLQYIDFRFNGTASGTTAFLGYGANTDTAAANGQTWTSAIYAKVIAQPTPPVSYSQNFRLGQAGGTFLSNTTQNFTPTSTLARYVQTVTIANALTQFASSEFYANLTNGATYDFTIRIAAPQMELGAFATTFIPTTTAAVTRLVDTPILNNGAFLPTAYPFTLFAEIDINDTGVGYPISFINSATSNNYFSIEYVGNTWYAVSRPSATSVFASGSFTTTRGRHKVAALFTNSTIKLYIDGSPIATGSNTNAFNSAVNDLCVGLLRTTTDNGVRTSIFQSAVFNRELTNAELAQITTL
jgi:hypothetical protein